MKFKLTFFTLVVLFSFQSLRAQQFTLGLLGGVHGYKVAFEDPDDKDQFKSKVKLGYRLGAFIAFPLENNFSWSTEVYFSRKGRKINFNDGTMTNDAKYNFIEISVLLRKAYDVDIIKGLEGKWFFNIGPNINYWVNGKGSLDANVDLDYTVKFGEPEGDIMTNYITENNRWLFGLDFGIGMEAPIIGNRITQVELRFTLGQTFLGTKTSSEMPNNIFFEDNLRSNYRVLTFIARIGQNLDIMDSKKGKSTIKNKRRRR